MAQDFSQFAFGRPLSLSLRWVATGGAAGSSVAWAAQRDTAAFGGRESRTPASKFPRRMTEASLRERMPRRSFDRHLNTCVGGLCPCAQPRASDDVYGLFVLCVAMVGAYAPQQPRNSAGHDLWP